MDGRAAARKLLDLSTKIGAPLEFGKLDAYTRSRMFDDFMKQHQGRNTESVEAIFYEGPAGQVSLSILSRQLRKHRPSTASERALTSVSDRSSHLLFHRVRHGSGRL